MTIANEVARLESKHGWDSPVRGTQTDHLFTVTAESVASAYTSEQMEELDGGEGGWWYDTRNYVLRLALRRFPVDGVLWDVGSGSGIVTEYLMREGWRAVGVEPNAHGAQISASRGVPSICGVLDDLALPDNSLAGVGMFDVLEHLDDRRAMLTEVHRVLKPGGRMYLTLPALQSLWTGFDEADGHRLRYSRATIRDEVERVGLTIEYDRYFFLLSLPVLFLVRVVPHRLGRRPLLSKKQMVVKSGGRLGKLATAFELWWSRVGVVGTSVLVVARKP
jgi:SAM-dependent methyltransferase